MGNVWRFPYVTGQNGGAAFIVIYFLCVLIMGVPVMLCEFLIGRHAQTNTARAYSKLANGTPWKWVGYMGVLTAAFIIGYYGVVSGWTLQYVLASVTGQLHGTPDDFRAYFSEFSTNPIKPIIWMTLLVGMTHYVIVHGIEDGIEKASKIMMPLLFLLLLVLVGCSLMLPGAMDGVEFLLKPDFSKLTSQVLLEGLGQAFFSLSLGTACLCTYASYFSRHTPLLKSAVQIALMDSGIAILAGLMIFPAAFSVGVQPDSGPSLIFITLPNVFQQAFGSTPFIGQLVSILFYALLVFAALTSTISMHEIGTAFFHEELGLRRGWAAWILTIVCSVICVFCSLSVGARPDISVMGLPLMDFCDKLTAQVMLPMGALLTSILLGWFVPKRLVKDEFTNWGTTARSVFDVYLFSVRYVVPFCILLILAHQFGII